MILRGDYGEASRMLLSSKKKDCTCRVLYVHDSTWLLRRGFAYATVLKIGIVLYCIVLGGLESRGLTATYCGYWKDPKIPTIPGLPVLKRCSEVLVAISKV